MEHNEAGQLRNGMQQVQHVKDEIQEIQQQSLNALNNTVNSIFPGSLSAASVADEAGNDVPPVPAGNRQADAGAQAMQIAGKSVQQAMEAARDSLQNAENAVKGLE